MGIHAFKQVGRPPVMESKDAVLKARTTPTEKDIIRAFCAGRGMTKTDYLTTLASLSFDYFDHIHLLNEPEVMAILVPLLTILSKKF